ncbi:DUF4062 domain-containing protein [Flavobacterium cellulosilyticum]|uniref:DUF4062 domain-containing protein n=1 Tax=Flavobacterium cellulosilyticum TaxID=2541731 RepID=A0A4R5C563_9FLAO|nr:DUF4062 domain-containing protein [Flavobacterium cellulosilyticum]TDD93606.1 DUF4062 domain-containing protein [Flavobacterium cellulosilyticum]
MEKRKVYLSSTFKDLESYRTLVIKKFESEFSESFELCRVMEYMYDNGKSIPSIEECIEEVKESDIYLLILGNRIGSYPPNSDKTYTELEYETALSMRDEKFIFRFVNTNFKKTECEDENKYQKIKSMLSELRPQEFKNLSTFENRFLTCMSVLLQQPVKSQNQRNFYIIFSIIIGLIGAITTYITYTSTIDFDYNIAVTSLVPLIFSCIILFILKDILFPTTMSTSKT